MGMLSAIAPNMHRGRAYCSSHVHFSTRIRMPHTPISSAETSATTVQLVSVCFSVFIAVLLTYAGSIWQLSIATVLMYQAAWSALSIAVCALKQHS